jgi:rod shape-determining protein MreC
VALPRRGGKARYRLALLVLTAVTLLTLDFRGFGPLESAQSTARDLLSPVRSGAETVTSPIGDAFRGVIDYGDLKDENAKLRAELEEARGQQLEGEAASEELARLKEQLDLPQLDGIGTVVARIAAGPAGNFEENVVEIDKGSSSGLREGMPVMTNAGLVGKLVRVDRNRSVVELVTAADFAVGVRIGNEVALARGTGSGSTLRATEGLSRDNPAQIDEPVLTNGGAGSTFPPGVPVGRVSAIDKTSAVPVIDVALEADIENLDYVTVLLYTPSEEN